jgi:hypothetical protein
MTRRWVTVGLCLAALTACTSFSTVRSAEVRPGPSVSVQASIASRPGDDAAWFWSYDCALQCDHSIPATDLMYEQGWRPSRGLAYTLGVGLSGVHPYAEAYVQFASARRLPIGLGARLGNPFATWTEHQIYGRVDLPITSRQRLLLNPALFYHAGNSPNGENPGSFLGFVQGVGVEFDLGAVSVRPAAAVVWGRAERTSYGQRYGPTTKAFGTASLALSVHRPRTESSRR